MPPSTSDDHARPPSVPLRVLLVEDRAEMRGSIRLALEVTGVAAVVAEAATAAAAIDAAGRVEFDVVLVDVRLGDEDGFALVDRLLEGGLRPDQVVVLSAWDRPFTIGRASTRGVRYVSKGDLHNWITELRP